MSTKKRTYSEIEHIVIIANFKGSDKLYQFHVKCEDAAYVIDLMAQLGCVMTEKPLEMMEFVRRSELEVTP